MSKIPTNYTLDNLALSEKHYLELKTQQNLIASWVKTIADKTGVQIDLSELEKIA